MKKAFITIDVGLIILTIIPVIVVLADCIDSAVNGVIPWREDSTFIYGMPAFFNTLGVYFVFGFVLVGNTTSCYCRFYGFYRDLREEEKTQS